MVVNVDLADAEFTTAACSKENSLFEPTEMMPVPARLLSTQTHLPPSPRWPIRRSFPHETHGSQKF